MLLLASFGLFAAPNDIAASDRGSGALAVQSGSENFGNAPKRRSRSISAPHVSNYQSVASSLMLPRKVRPLNQSLADSGGIESADSVTFRMNAGVAGTTEIEGVEWQGDSAWLLPGSVAAIFSVQDLEIIDTDLDELYRTERFGSPFGYALPLANGVYRIRLHFAEIFHGVRTAGLEPGDRVFDVFLEDQRRVTELDLALVSGDPLTAHIIDQEVQVNDNVLDVRLELGPNGVNQAKLSALEVFVIETFPQPGTVTATPQEVDFGTLNTDESITAEIRLFNPGEEPVTISNIEILDDDGVFLLPDPPLLSVELAPNAQIPLAVSFAPTMQELFDGLLIIHHDGSNTPLEIKLGGIGRTPVVTPGPTILRLNAGLASSTTIDGSEWEGDEVWLVPGSVSSTFAIPGAEIAATDIDTLYETDRFGNPFGYTIPVENGRYSVRLHFAEIFHGVFTPTLEPGDRVFDVLLEGERRIAELDLAVEIGNPMTAYSMNLETIVNDANLDIRLELGPNGIDQAKLSGLEVFLLEIIEPKGMVKAIPSALNFGSLEVGKIKIASIFLNNPGNEGVTIDSITIDDEQDEFSLQSPIISAVELHPGAQLMLKIGALPLAGGSINGTLLVSHDGINELLEIPLSGVGVPDLFFADGFER